jgi:hypothetical protein
LRQRRPCLEQHGFEGIDVVRKVVSVRHAAQFTQVPCRLQ